MAIVWKERLCQLQFWRKNPLRGLWVRGMARNVQEKWIVRESRAILKLAVPMVSYNYISS